MKNLAYFLFLSLLVFGCSSETDQDLMSKADESIKQGDYASAVASYDKIADDYPESALASEALYQKASLYQNKMIKNLSEKESFEHSVAVYQKVYTKYPESERAPMSLFMAAFIQANELKNFDEATSLYRLFLEKYPDHRLASSAKDELDYMGLSPDQILEKKSSANM